MSNVVTAQEASDAGTTSGDRGRPILRAKGIHKTYRMGAERLEVLAGASLQLSAGEFVAIMGASGSGKSTLLHILGALDMPDRGQVMFEGTDVFAGSARSRDRYRNHTFGFVFQFYHLLPELSVLENILMPAMVGDSTLRWMTSRRRARARAEALIESFNLSGRIRHRPNQLSGGERQRVALARALMNEPRILYADEPTGNLDAETGREILALLKRLNEAGQTLVLVTHDAAVAEHAHRTLHLTGGQLKKSTTHESRPDATERD